MKSFNTFLQEKFIPGQESELARMLDGDMPMSPSILQKFEIPIEKTYHVTSFDKIKNIIKLQGQRKDISTFTKGSSGISKGARESADVLFTLEGFSSFSSSLDLGSILDRNGIRWIAKSTRSDKDNVINNQFTVVINKRIVKEFKLKNRFDIFSLTNEFTNKEKANFIKFYFNEAKKIITKKLIKNLQASIKKSFAFSNSKKTFNNNEIFLHGFKILKAQVITSTFIDEQEASERFKEETNFKLDGSITQDQVASINI